jgi:hypothetical protein
MHLHLRPHTTRPEETRMTVRLLWLPERLRAWGLTVVEQPGWRTRGAGFARTPVVAVGHHTATSARAPGDLPTLRILRDGRDDLPGPLCQVALSRSGVAHVIASGKANHAGPGRWAGITSSSLTVGCEVEHPGTGPWQPAQLAAFDRVMAALLDGLGQGASKYCGHREWAQPAGRKVDPGGVDLDRQRQRIHGLLQAGPRPSPTTAPKPAPAPAPPTVQEDDMAKLVTADGVKVYVVTAYDGARHVADQTELAALRAAGVLAADEKPKKIDPAQLEALIRVAS